jgi:hypothetical protein
VLFLVHRLLSPWWRRRQVPPKRRFLQEPHGVTTQKTPFFVRGILYTTARLCISAAGYNSSHLPQEPSYKILTTANTEPVELAVKQFILLAVFSRFPSIHSGEYLLSVMPASFQILTGSSILSFCGIWSRYWQNYTTEYLQSLLHTSFWCSV